jgi:hypothetical protein
MSYILDALRKSEQQRQHGVTPSLSTALISSDVEKQPAFLLYGMVATLLICAGMLIGWIHPWQQDKAGVMTKLIPPRPHESKPPQTMPTLQPLLPESELARKPEQALPVQKSASSMESLIASGANRLQLEAPIKPATPARRAQPIASSTTLPNEAATRIVHEAATPMVEKAVQPALENPVSNGPTKSAQEQEIVEMAELPLTLQQEIPMMSISVHAYSGTPEKRLVRINDHLLHEGESLTPDLRLEQITPDGMIFSYKKYLFRHGLK